MKPLIWIINIFIGIWLSASYVLMFNLFRLGHSIGEPNETIATLELAIACILVAWFVWQIPYWIIKAGKKN